MPYYIKPIKAIVLILITNLMMACGGGKASSPQVSTPDITPTVPADITPTPVVPVVTRFSHVKIHHDLLKNQAMVYGEAGSLPPYLSITRDIQISKSAPKGSLILNVQDNTGLLKNQLIVYLSGDNNYHVGRIKTLASIGTIELYEPIKSSVAVGAKAWDFYGNASHANAFGFKAIADFAIKSLHFNNKTTGNHVLLGDSWFDEGSIHSRLSQKLSNASIINQGVGGNTSYDLIARFDRDVTPYAPDYVWILSGTNDYWLGVDTAQYKANLDILINKSKAIGAKVIVIDSSVGYGTGSTGIANQYQSEKYVESVLELNK